MKTPHCPVMPLFGVWLVVVACSPIATPATAETFTLDATLVEDTYVRSDQGTTNYDGDAYEVYIRNYSAFGRVGLVQFTLPQLPAGYTVADILDVELAGVLAWRPASPNVMSLELLGLDVNPDPTTVTYNDLLEDRKSVV